jgi:hypothetical protein
MACAIEHPEFSGGNENDPLRLQRLTRTLAKLG